MKTYNEKIVELKYYKNLLLYAKEEQERQEQEIIEEQNREKGHQKVLVLTKKYNGKEYMVA